MSNPYHIPNKKETNKVSHVFSNHPESSNPCHISNKKQTNIISHAFSNLPALSNSYHIPNKKETSKISHVFPNPLALSNPCHIPGKILPIHRSILQCDGADTSSDTSSNDDEDDITTYESEDEVDAEPEPVVLVPAVVQVPGQALVLEVDPTGRAGLPNSLPLGIVLNARSLYNKISNFIRFLREIGPDYSIVS